MTLRSFRDEAMGISLAIDERFLDVGFAADQESPSAHLLTCGRGRAGSRRRPPDRRRALDAGPPAA